MDKLVNKMAVRVAHVALEEKSVNKKRYTTFEPKNTRMKFDNSDEGDSYDTKNKTRSEGCARTDEIAHMSIENGPCLLIFFRFFHAQDILH